MTYELKAGSTQTKSLWAIETKVAIVALTRKGLTAKAAIARVAEELGLSLPTSYTTAAASHLFRFKKEINKALLSKDGERVKKICDEAGLELNQVEKV